MTNELKFRAWDNQSKIMFTMPTRKSTASIFDGDDYGPKIISIRLDLNEVTCMINGNIQYCYNLEKCKDYFHLMQFTGLIDCGGKEIYEGDIIQYDSCHYKIIFDNESARFITELIYPIRGTEMYMFTTELLDSTITPQSSIKIIGNIWENQELLNEK